MTTLTKTYLMPLWKFLLEKGKQLALDFKLEQEEGRSQKHIAPTLCAKAIQNKIMVGKAL